MNKIISRRLRKLGWQGVKHTRRRPCSSAVYRQINSSDRKVDKTLIRSIE